MITAVFENVKAALAKTLEEQGKGVPFHELGEDHLASQHQAPWIVWCPQGAEIVPRGGLRAPTTRRVTTGTPGPGEQSATERISEPLMYASRRELIEAHIAAGPRFQDCEELVNHFVAALRVQATGFAFKPRATDWTLGQDQKTKPFHLCVFAFEIRVPFTFERQPIAAAPLTLQVTGDIVDAIDN